MALGLISGITKGTAGSMRNAEELSMTTAPALAAIGPNFFEMDPPALKNAISTPAKLFSVSSSTSMSRPPKVIFLPLDRADASRRSVDIGNRLCSRQRRNSTPTAPVAPTIATRYCLLIAVIIASQVFDRSEPIPPARLWVPALRRCGRSECCRVPEETVSPRCLRTREYRWYTKRWWFRVRPPSRDEQPECRESL